MFFLLPQFWHLFPQIWDDLNHRGFFGISTNIFASHCVQYNGINVAASNGVLDVISFHISNGHINTGVLRAAFVCCCLINEEAHSEEYDKGEDRNSNLGHLSLMWSLCSASEESNKLSSWRWSEKCAGWSCSVCSSKCLWRLRFGSSVIISNPTPSLSPTRFLTYYSSLWVETEQSRKIGLL